MIDMLMKTRFLLTTFSRVLYFYTKISFDTHLVSVAGKSPSYLRKPVFYQDCKLYSQKSDLYLRKSVLYSRSF